MLASVCLQSNTIFLDRRARKYESLDYLCLCILIKKYHFTVICIRNNNIISLIEAGEAHVNDHTTSLSTLGLDPVCVFGHLFHGVESACRRPGQPDRWFTVPASLFRVSDTAVGGTQGIL